jgi:hypothetical protein
LADKLQEVAKSFDAYEVIGVIIPGAVLALLLTFECPSLRGLLGDKGLSVGDLGLFLIVAFVLGHLVQALGNLLEWLFWLPSGMPTSWACRARQSLLSDGQREALQAKVSAMEGAPMAISKLGRGKWNAIIRRISGRVFAAGRSSRVEAHNRTYGMCRGLGAALAVALAWVAVEHGDDRQLLGGLALALACALWRMWRMGVNYARALLLVFIDLDLFGGPP